MVKPVNGFPILPSCLELGRKRGMVSVSKQEGRVGISITG
jgi:hypothetical protein